ncbi:hypothetical protein KXX11_004024, partial [Aspergillus fumigatus]
MPPTGKELADRLLDLIALHDASNIAAVIVEPFAGSAGVVIPPQGYLQRLREICTANNILLIFDEVITGFGRLGSNFGADYYGVVPDMLNFAKAVTNGVIPLGGVICTDRIYNTMMEANAGSPAHAIEFFHGYTYSGHPVACAAAMAGAMPPAAWMWFSLIRIASHKASRWLPPPPQRTANFCAMRRPGR